jgi:hypothetical protein
MRCGRAAAAGCSPSEPGGPPEPDDPGPPLVQRPRSVVTASWSRPMAGRRRPAQDALRGLVSTCSVPCSPATQPAPWPRTSARVGPAARRPRSRDAGPAAALGWGQPRASQARPTPHHPLPSGPMQATMPPADHGARRPAAPNPGRPATRATPVQRGADSPAARRGHRRPVRPDTWMQRTPGHRTPGRWTSADRLDGRPHGGTGDADRAPTACPASGRSDGHGHGDRRPGLARPRSGWRVRRRSAIHDGSAVTTPAAPAVTAAATASGAAPSGTKPRLGALLSSVHFRSSVERTARRRPLWRAGGTETGVTVGDCSGLAGVLADVRAMDLPSSASRVGVLLHC